MSNLVAPFPYFGGKSRITSEVWNRFGDVGHYVEPFAGSLAVLLSRPQPFNGVETVNDLDGMISNFWRALQADPDSVAYHADWPVNENDLHARHSWLVRRKDSLQTKLEGDPDYFDAKVAGWWVWGIACWIGSGWCSGDGPWQVVETEDGSCKLVQLSNQGQGVNRNLVQISRHGQGVNCKRVHLGGQGQDQCQVSTDAIRDLMLTLADRLRRVRVCCGDWSRVCGGKSGDAIAALVQSPPCGIFLDPPYSKEANRRENIYRCDDLSVAHHVREWAIKYGEDCRFRIALCGYEGEHVMPDHWECFAWKSSGGFNNRSGPDLRGNCKRERIWFSPHCLKPNRVAQLCFALAD